ncbi:TonB-linked outer membrane protein, SusC/RagA family [Sphingobacterium lactis]|uniref:TonB-linked outer membrane protein, SusC/RagA family n=1 Tax=Sphingobacterium lactis TaxID=797291 RepID=A0A1H5VF88_9SPHI|nr:TonB-linked outer membrane protein, SusC/RagA family [Sphingobacterium lactis]
MKFNSFTSAVRVCAARFFSKRSVRLTSTFILVCCALHPHLSLAQYINLNRNTITIGEALQEFRKQAKVSILYNDASLDRVQVSNINIKNASIQQAMDNLLKGTAFEYRVTPEKSILIKRKAVQQTASRREQQQTLSGRVIDDQGKPLENVTVSIENGRLSTMTNTSGEFSIVSTKDDVLQVSFIGYGKKVVHAKLGQAVTIQLQPLENLVDEVVVIGYGEVKKKDLTGSVSIVNVEDLQNIPVPRVDQMLQGRIAGAEIVSSSGEPGAGTSIRIRGTRSISATNEPLYVVDGVMDAITSLNDLNPDDVASIQVLKDASSTAIYGSRGSNGVILITTKKGTAGKNDVALRADFGFSEIPRFLDLMNAQEFAELQNDRYYLANVANQTKPIENYPYPNPEALGEGTNWTEAITRRAPYQNYTVTAAGGSDKTRYYFSGNFNDNQGIIKASGLKRYQARLNLDHTFSDKFKGGFRFNYSYLDHELNKADIGTQTLWYRSTIFLAPTIPVYKEDGSLNDWNSQWYTGTLFDSPMANVMMKRMDQVKKTTSPMMYLEYEPIKGLKFKSQLSFYDYNRFDDNFYPSTLPTRMNNKSGAYAYKRAYTANNYLNENTVAWLGKTKKHSYDALYGFTIQKNWYTNLSASGDGYFIDEISTNDLSAVPSKEMLNVASNFENRTRVSHLGRLNYNYNSTYYLTLTGRADAGSNFAANRKWAFFPSAAFKWNMKNETWMKDANWINELGLRLSAGTSGNDAISTYQSLDQVASTMSGYIFDGAIPVAYFPNRIKNEDLTWEKTVSYNAGIDFAILNRKLTFTMEAYMSKTSDLLLTVQLPHHGGFPTRLMNLGKTENKGLELTVESQNINRKNFSWNSTFTIAHNSQKVVDIGTFDRVPTYVNPYGSQYMMYGYIPGKPLNALWGMEYAGVWKNLQEVEDNKVTKQYASASTAYYTPGRQRYIDQNNDGILDNNDLVYLGNADPIVYGGLQNSFRYKKLYVNVFFNYNLGGKIYNPTELFMGTGTYLSNQYRYMVNAWHPVRNPDSDYPRADSKDDIPNDRFIYDATFLRLKNVTVSYVFDVKKLTKNKLSSVTASLSGNNLYLWKKYNGYDPEVSTESGGSTIRRMDNGAYPNSRTVTASLNIKF